MSGAATARRSGVVAVLWCLALVTAGVGGAAASPAAVDTGAGTATPTTAAAGTTPVVGSASATRSVTGNATAGSSLTPAADGDLAVSNPHLVAYVDDDTATRGGVGAFTLQAAAADGGTVDLLYGGGDAWSSYLTVRVDGTAYVTGTEVLGATNMDGYVTRAPTVRGDSVVTEWTLPEGVVVTQTVTLDGPRARFAVETENADGRPHDAEARFLFDYQLGAADGSPAWRNGTRITTETVVENASAGNASLDAWRVGDADPSATGPTGVATAATTPTRVAFARWNPAYGSPYAYDADPDAEFYNASRGAGDGAGLVYYDFGRLGAGESATARTAYGPDVPERSAALYFPDQATRGANVTVEGAMLPYGGFVGVYDAGGDLRGVSAELPAGGGSDVTVDLDQPLLASGSLSVVAYRDTNGNDRADLGVAGGDDAYDGFDGPATDRATVTLVGPFDASVRFEDQTTDGRAVVVDSVTLDEGGFVAVRDPAGAATDPGSVIGVSEYLPAGTHEDVRVRAYRVPGGQFTRLALSEDRTLAATPYRDTDANRRYDFLDADGGADRPYAGGDAVADRAAVTVERTHGDDDPTASGSGGADEPDPTYYQVDFVTGEPIERLGEEGLYADADRLIRWALGNADDGVTERGTAWANESIRSCVDASHVRRTADGARVAFTVADGCGNVTLSLVSYETASAEFSRETADQQRLFDATTRTYGPGEHVVTVALPDDD